MDAYAVYLSDHNYSALCDRLRAQLVAAAMDTVDEFIPDRRLNLDSVKLHGVDLEETVRVLLGLGFNVWPDRHGAAPIARSRCLSLSRAGEVSAVSRTREVAL